MCETCGCQGTTLMSANASVSTSPADTPPLVERVSDSLQNGIKVVIGSNRKSPRRLKSLLHGTVLGHPLHPAITDVPIGAWLLAALFDIIWLIFPVANLWAARGALAAVIVGLLGAVGAAVTGWPIGAIPTALSGEWASIMPCLM